MTLTFQHEFGPLFHSGELRRELQHRFQKLEDEVARIPEGNFLNTEPEGLITALIERARIHLPEIDHDTSNWRVHDEDATVPDPTIPTVVFHGLETQHRTPPRLSAQRIWIRVPVHGPIDLLRLKPSSSTSTRPYAALGDSFLALRFDVPDTNRDFDGRAAAQRELGQIERYLRFAKADVEQHDKEIASKARRIVQGRREKCLLRRARLENLGIPLATRANTPRTYALPDVQKVITPSLPVSADAHFELEPTLQLEHYEHILSVCSNMALVMERSPSSFQKIDEEDLRHHFLVQLNGHFKGAATGETFNYGGKTDILLTHEGKNAFIAECKYWKGQKKFREAVDQLFDYLTWRDAKTAIIIFDTNNDPSVALREVDKTLPDLPGFIARSNYPSESGFRAQFNHPRDENRPLLLTVLLFHIPGARKKRTRAKKKTKTKAKKKTKKKSRSRRGDPPTSNRE